MDSNKSNKKWYNFFSLQNRGHNDLLKIWALCIIVMTILYFFIKYICEESYKLEPDVIKELYKPLNKIKISD